MVLAGFGRPEGGAVLTLLGGGFLTSFSAGGGCGLVGANSIGGGFIHWNFGLRGFGFEPSTPRNICIMCCFKCETLVLRIVLRGFGFEPSTSKNIDIL